MSHKSVRLLIQDTAKYLRDDIFFFYGRQSDFDQEVNNRFPVITLDPLEYSPSFTVNNSTNYQQSWSIGMTFLNMEKETSSDAKASAVILDDMADLVDKFINKLNRFAEGNDINEIQTEQITILNIQALPAIRVLKDVLTGYTLTFTLITPDSFDYCSIYE